ncbi:mitochondrial carrier [Dentipellis sp. KUC8613]|nr:mitochondrial carrier [Dentipellis sp. KUC8613]
MSSDAAAALDTRPSQSRRKLQPHNLDRLLRSGVAGGIAGCVAKTVVAPLDRVKILFQASNPDFQKYAGSWSGAFCAASQIYKEGGIRGLLQGHSATLLRVFPYAGIKFLAYDQAHVMLMPTPADETNLRRFAAGALSGTCSVLLTYPLELIRVRMAFQTRAPATATPLPPGTLPQPPAQRLRPSFVSAARTIYHEGAVTPSSSSSGAAPLMHRVPLLKFYRGFTVSLTGMVPYAGTSFLMWGWLRATLPPRKRPAPLHDLGVGAIAGAVAQSVSYPFEVVRRRMQVGGLTRPDRWLGWAETVRTVWASGGWRAFYVGLSIGYLKVVPMNAVSFAVWVGMKRLFNLEA